MHDDTHRVQVEEFSEGFLFLPNFDSTLTYHHNALQCQVPSLLKMAQQLGQLLVPNVRLHRDHVLFVSALNTQPHRASSLRSWLERQGFAVEGLIRVLRATTVNPIEDGYFSCLCILAAGLQNPSLPSAGQGGNWEEYSTEESHVANVLEEFMTAELQRICGSELWSCMKFLDDLYRQPERRVDPPKAVRCFDTEVSYVEFAASVWTANELHFWSRPVQYSK